jgi:hypothetical protein
MWHARGEGKDRVCFKNLKKKKKRLKDLAIDGKYILKLVFK